MIYLESCSQNVKSFPRVHHHSSLTFAYDSRKAPNKAGVPVMIITHSATHCALHLPLDNNKPGTFILMNTEVSINFGKIKHKIIDVVSFMDPTVLGRCHIGRRARIPSMIYMMCG